MFRFLTPIHQILNNELNKVDYTIISINNMAIKTKYTSLVINYNNKRHNII